MLDAFIPCVRTLESQVQAGKPIGEAWRKAAEAAESAAQATAPLRPRIGRARPLAERSVGHADAGAVSFAYIVRAIADQMTGGRGRAAPVPVLLNSRRPIMEL
jgi:dihydroxyacetone kinase